MSIIQVWQRSRTSCDVLNFPFLLQHFLVLQRNNILPKTHILLMMIVKVFPIGCHSNQFFLNGIYFF